MKIAYLLYREDIFSPLVESQVLNNLYRISSTNCEIHIIWLKRIDYYFKHQDKINIVRKKLEEHGIILHELPIIVGRFPLDKKMSDYVEFQTKHKIIKILSKYEIDIIHTRGYNAGLLATNLLKNNKSIKHVFDPRSPYLTELISTYGVKEDDDLFKFWKKNEELVVKNATATISISNTFYDYLKTKGDSIIIIPNNSEMDDVNVIKKRAKEQRRNSFCFVGSLGYGWNNVHEYIRFMKDVWEIDSTILLELYVLNQEIALKELENANISADKYIIKTLPQSEVGKTIAGCIAGLQIMSKSDSRLGIKTVDYISAGIPVICNDNAMGASYIVEKYGVGWNISKSSLRDIINDANQNVAITEHCINVAFDNFSTEATAKLYSKLYIDICK